MNSWEKFYIKGEKASDVTLASYCMELARSSSRSFAIVFFSLVIRSLSDWVSETLFCKKTIF